MSEIQYWINQNGVQAGPVTRDELEHMSLTDEAYVWRAGMADWVRITEMSELAGCYQVGSNASPSAPDQPIPTSEAAEPGEEPEPDAEPAATADGTAEPYPPLMPPPVAPDPYYAQPLAPGMAMQQPAMQQAAAEAPKCPPTNLVWAIIATLLCCLPLGVVAIIYSAKVSQKFSEGDLAAAEHYSEVSAWWCIGTIVGGIILSPIVSLIQMALLG